jgi:response regulator RpfG family c-di-GMP phosphodiesterase
MGVHAPTHHHRRAHPVTPPPALAPVAALVRSSDERFDGTGYRNALPGEQIPLGARIIAACEPTTP